ncbi:hypothetical protein [Azospirillum endophyticum]
MGHCLPAYAGKYSRRLYDLSTQPTAIGAGATGRA